MNAADLLRLPLGELHHTALTLWTRHQAGGSAFELGDPETDPDPDPNDFAGAALEDAELLYPAELPNDVAVYREAAGSVVIVGRVATDEGIQFEAPASNRRGWWGVCVVGPRR